MADPLAVGIVGAGGRTQSHCASLADIDGAELVAICDIEADRAVETAESFDIPHAFADRGDMFEGTDLDAAYVVTPPHAMDPVVTDVLERGLHLFVEKPPGIAVGQTERWAALADEHGCRTAVGFQRRFHPLVVAARERIAARDEVRYAAARFHKHRGTEPYLLYNAIHPLDLLVHLGGAVASVDAHLGQVAADPETFDPLAADLYTATLEHAGGGASYLACDNAAGGRSLTVELHGDGISAYADIHGRTGTDALRIQADGERFGDAEVLATPAVLDDDLPDALTHDPDYYFDPIEEGTFQLNRHFVERARRDEPTDVALDETVETMRVAGEIARGDRLAPAFGGP